MKSIKKFVGWWGGVTFFDAHSNWDKADIKNSRDYKLPS